MIQTSFFPHLEKDESLRLIKKTATSTFHPKKLEEVVPDKNILKDTYLLSPTGGFHPFFRVPNTLPRYQLPIWPFVKRIKYKLNVGRAQLNCDFGKTYGYPRLTFVTDETLDGPTRYDTLIHQIVALAWIPNPDNKPYVMHINDDRTNYLPENLMWGTASENNKGSLRKRLTDTMEQKYKELDIKGIIQG